MNRKSLFWIVLIGTLVLDQLLKHWVRMSMHERQILPLPFPGVLEMTLTYNKGIAFGLFQGAGIVLAPVAFAIFAGAIYYNSKHPKEPVWGHVAAALLASGAMGNLYDRLFLGRVTDMFLFRFINFPVFNVADTCITVAASMLILSWIREAFVPAQAEPVACPPAISPAIAQHETPAASSE